jgi:hypothetical protein
MRIQQGKTSDLGSQKEVEAFKMFDVSELHYKFQASNNEATKNEIF